MTVFLKRFFNIIISICIVLSIFADGLPSFAISENAILYDLNGYIRIEAEPINSAGASRVSTDWLRDPNQFSPNASGNHWVGGLQYGYVDDVQDIASLGSYYDASNTPAITFYVDAPADGFYSIVPGYMIHNSFEYPEYSMTVLVNNSCVYSVPYISSSTTPFNINGIDIKLTEGVNVIRLLPIVHETNKMVTLTNQGKSYMNIDYLDIDKRVSPIYEFNEMSFNVEEANYIVGYSNDSGKLSGDLSENVKELGLTAKSFTIDNLSSASFFGFTFNAISKGYYDIELTFKPGTNFSKNNPLYFNCFLNGEKSIVAGARHISNSDDFIFNKISLTLFFDYGNNDVIITNNMVLDNADVETITQVEFDVFRIFANNRFINRQEEGTPNNEDNRPLGSISFGNNMLANIPNDALLYNGHFYKVFDESISWQSANAACRQMGGHLATITSAGENSFLTALGGKSKKKAIWLGGVRKSNSSSFQWITGEKFSYSNFDAGEPNNQGDNENYLMLFTSNCSEAENVGKWNDEYGAGQSGSPDLDLSQFGYICEWGTEKQYGYDENMFFMSEEEALLFIGFLTNAKELKNVEQIKESDFFRIITGTYVGDDIVIKSKLTSAIIVDLVASQASESEKQKSQLYETIIGFLEDTLPDNPSPLLEVFISDRQAACMDEMNSYLDDIATDLLSISNSVGGDLMGEAFKKISNVFSVEDYANMAAASFTAACYVIKTEEAGRYNYFNNYIIGRSFGEPGEETFEIWQDFNELNAYDTSYFSKLIDASAPILGSNKESFLDHTDTIDRMAEFAHSLSTIKAYTQDCTHKYYCEAHKDSTCVSEGYNTYKCSLCGNKYTENLPLLSHSYSAYTLKDATCTTAGSVEYVCSCSKSYTVSKPPIGHNFNNKASRSITNEFKCNNCLCSFSAEHEHVFNDTVISPTCEQHGYTVRKCALCDFSYDVDIISCKGHTYTTMSTVNPTCFEDGYIVKKCDACQTEVTETISKLEHRYFCEYQKATCQEGGKAIYTCAFCGFIKAEIVSATRPEHNFKITSKQSSTCIDDGNTTLSCTSCQMENSIVLPKKGHAWLKNIEIDRMPTQNSVGIISNHCKNCSLRKNEKEIVYLNTVNSNVIIHKGFSVGIMVEKSIMNETAYSDMYMEFLVEGVRKKVYDYSVYGDYYCYMLDDIGMNVDRGQITSTLCASVDGIKVRGKTAIHNIPYNKDILAFDFDSDGMICEFDSLCYTRLSKGFSTDELADVNGDGKSDLKDLLRAKLILSEKTILGNTDFNNNGILDANDLVFVKRFLLMLS